jgi:regulator of sirC expression with transglutaminase-like and TPR domain
MQARAALERYVEERPDAEDRELIREALGAPP